MDEKRRQLLKIAAAGIGTSFASAPVSAVECGPPSSAKPSHLLIDVHCHIFNADDLPVRGFANHVFMRTTGDGWLNVGNGIASVVDKVVQLTAPGVRTETDLLEAILMASNKDPKKMYEAYCRIENPHGGILAQATNFRLHNALALMDLYPETDLFLPAMVDLGLHLDDKAPITLRQQIDLMEYIFAITGGRFHGYVAFDPLRQAKYNESRPFDHDAPLSPLNLVKRAVQEQGFVGVKLYPPMGFRPSKNDKLLACVNDRNKKFVNRYDDILKELFDWCAEAQVPIMTHCNDSNYADVHHGANPECSKLGTAGQWAALIAENPRYKGRLKIDLGHFGRADFHTRTRLKYEHAQNTGLEEEEQLLRETKRNEEEAREFHDALRAHPESLFADLANYDKLDNRKMRSAFKSEISVAMTDSGLGKQLMYGTDWFMTSQGARPYLDNMKLVLPPDEFPGFYGRNAVKFLGLANGERTRERLMNFYRKWGISKPEWMDRVDDPSVT